MSRADHSAAIHPNDSQPLSPSNLLSVEVSQRTAVRWFSLASQVVLASQHVRSPLT